MESDARLMEWLPFWMGYSRLLLAPPLAFAASFVGSWIAARLILPRRYAHPDLHWAERARLVHPARLVAGMGIGWAPVFFTGVFRSDAGLFNSVTLGWVSFLVAIAAFAGASLASNLIHCRATGKRAPWWRHARSQLVWIFFLCPQLVIMLLMLGTVGAALDVASVACGLAGATALCLSARYSGLPIARLLGSARPASARLQALIDDVGERMGVRPRRVEELDIGTANAFALPACGGLVFTRRILAELDDAALRGVIAHEIGHLREPPSGLVYPLGMLAFLPLGLLVPIVHHFGGGGLVAAYVCSGASVALATRLGRRGEVRADRSVVSADVEGGDYARALEVVYESNLAPVVARSWTRHPSLYDRMLSAGVEPDFPRPRPPSLTRAAVGAVAAAALMIGAVFALQLPATLLSGIDRDRNPERAALTELVLRGPTRQALFRLATVRMSTGHNDAALGLVDAALERDPEQHAYLAARADLLSKRGRCGEAFGALADATDFASAEHSGACRWIRRATAALAANCEPSVALGDGASGSGAAVP